MAFKTDNQTLNDLGIFTTSGEESVFAIYNRCYTRGGIKLMEQMFRNPLTDVERIKERVACISLFEKNPMDFPYSTESFSASESYLLNNDVRTQLSIEDNTLGRRMGGLLGGDREFNTIYKGIVSTVEIIAANRDFLTKIAAFEGSDYIISHFPTPPDAVMKLVEEFEDQKKLTYSDCVDLDREFRFVHRDVLLAMFRAIHYVDVYYSVASVAQERGFVFAQVTDQSKEQLRLRGVFHPRLKNAVGNDVDVDQSKNMVFLTGANMAGKSTIMKSIAIAVYTAHVAFPVAAQSMDFVIRSGMFTTINLPDNINSGYSHFYSEVMRLKKVAQEVRQDNNLMIIFDELFRGTNVKDAYDATVEVVKAFSTVKKCTFIVSTHIIEAGEELAKSCENIQFIYMPTTMEAGVPKYSYKVAKGITEDRHGMVIINNEKIVEILESSH